MFIRLSFAIAIACATGSAVPAQTFFAPNRTPLPFGVPPGFSNRDLTMNVDETICVFASDRPGGAGGYDLWIATRPARGLAWGAPTPWAGNTPVDETGPGLSADGRELYFSQKGGGRDAEILRAVAPSAGSTAFGSPVRVTELNQVGADDTGPQPTVDGLTLFFHSDRTGGGDIYMATRSSTSQPWSAPWRLGIVNDATDSDYDPAPQAGGTVLWFSRRAPGRDADFYLSWRQAPSGAYTAPIAVTELNDARDQDGLYTAPVSGLTYFNGPSGALDIGLECVCRAGPTGGTPRFPTDWGDGRSSSAWNLPVLITTGASWELGRSASTSYYDWQVGGAVSYVTAISAGRAASPLVLPVLEWGAVELDLGVFATLGVAIVDSAGYADFTFPVPNRPSLRGQVIWSQGFGFTPTGIRMSPPQRITLR